MLLKNVARDFQAIIVRMISAVILPLLPLYIFGIFLNMTHSGQVYSILMVFIKIIGVIFIFTYLPAGLSVFYRSAVCTQKSVQTIGEDDACLFHSIGHTVIGGHHSGDFAADHQEWGYGGYSRICHSAMRHNSSVGKAR